jgi:hypothetical protein
LPLQLVLLLLLLWSRARPDQQPGLALWHFVACWWALLELLRQVLQVRGVCSMLGQGFRGCITWQHAIHCHITSQQRGCSIAKLLTGLAGYWPPEV